MSKEEKQRFQLGADEAAGDFDQRSSLDSISVDSTKDDSTNSAASSSDLKEDATSPASYSSASSSSLNGPLYELAELVAQLPIKRGLSKHYEGKSQSFTSLASVKSLEDLAKRENSYRRKRMKFSTSFGGGLDGHKYYTTPKPTITKKISSSKGGGSFLSTTARSDLIHICRPPPIPVQKHFKLEEL